MDETRRRIDAERALLHMQTTHAAIGPYVAKSGGKFYKTLQRELMNQVTGKGTGTKPDKKPASANRRALLADLKKMTR